MLGLLRPSKITVLQDPLPWHIDPRDALLRVECDPASAARSIPSLFLVARDFRSVGLPRFTSCHTERDV